jgi:hypothetical protein
MEDARCGVILLVQRMMVIARCQIWEMGGNNLRISKLRHKGPLENENGMKGDLPR